MASLSSLSSAYSALSAHRRRTEVISQNIANADTPGYTRQRAELQALGGLGGFSVIAGTRHVLGVDVADVSRLSDSMLDQQARQASSRSTSLAEQARATRAIEQQLGPLAGGTLSAQLQALWAGFADVANDPGSIPVRQVALERGDQVATTMRALATATVDQRRAEVGTLEARVAEVNDLAGGVATLDQQIVAAKAAGSQPNELVDRQARLLDRLAELVDLNVVERPNGTLGVYVDGHDLISEGTVKPLAVTTTATSDDALGPPGFDRVQVTVDRPGGRQLSIGGGHLNGLLTVVNHTLPQHLRELDGLATTIADTVNDLHRDGAGLDRETGRAFFDPSPPTAMTLRLSDDVRGQPANIAAAAAAPVAGEDPGRLDTTVARELAALAGSAHDPSRQADQLITSVGASVAALSIRTESATAATGRARGNADAVSGVNLDEELTNLMESQRAYEAAARMLTTIDQMLDTLINRTGLVGR